MKKFIWVVLLAGGLILGMESSALAKKGFYLGGGITYNTIGSDFDGKSVLFEDTDFIVVPKVHSGFGGGILAGYGITDAWAVEMSVLYSSHRAEWEGNNLHVGYTILNFDGKYSFRTSQPTQPYLLVGLNLPSLDIKDESGSLTTPEVGPGKLEGLGLNLGVGIDHYFNPHFSTGVGLVYRYVRYNSSDSGLCGLSPCPKAAGPEHRDEASGNGYSLILNTVYHF